MFQGTPLASPRLMNSALCERSGSGRVSSFAFSNAVARASDENHLRLFFYLINVPVATVSSLS